MPSSLSQLVFPGAFPGMPSTAELWNGGQLQLPSQSVQASAYKALDLHLPGGGWPLGGLTEVLHPASQGVEWQLVLPALNALLAKRSGAVMLVQPPYEPCCAALRTRGVAPQRLCQVLVPEDRQGLWASEQALQCQDVCAVLAWLPSADAAGLRRLQLVASSQAALLWVFRPQEERVNPSPAVLRVLVRQSKSAAVPSLDVCILKRRGPPLEQTLILPALQPHVAELTRAVLPHEEVEPCPGAAVEENPAAHKAVGARGRLRLVGG